ncbi:MAG TPA: hypothetical protein VEV81_03335, partial [Pyrinomonadaceae bacterium]|nr:hypothetical protein [Pyrinomonadaceae bacterium]
MSTNLNGKDDLKAKKVQAATALKESEKSKELIERLARSTADEDQLINAADMVGELHNELSDTTNNPLSLTQTDPLLTADNIMGLLQHRIAKLDEEINDELS